MVATEKKRRRFNNVTQVQQVHSLVKAADNSIIHFKLQYTKLEGSVYLKKRQNCKYPSMNK